MCDQTILFEFTEIGGYEQQVPVKDYKKHSLAQQNSEASQQDSEGLGQRNPVGRVHRTVILLNFMLFFFFLPHPLTLSKHSPYSLVHWDKQNVALSTEPWSQTGIQTFTTHQHSLPTNRIP